MTRSRRITASRSACLPSAILLQPFPQWLDIGRGGTYPRGDMPKSRIDDLNPEHIPDLTSARRRRRTPASPSKFRRDDDARREEAPAFFAERSR